MKNSKKTNDPSLKYDIQFTNNKQDVIDLLLSLNKDNGFVVTQLNDNEFEIIYDGGYNNVYDYKINLKIVGLTKNIHNKWFYWKFELSSVVKDDYIEVDNFGWSLGFMDFFIDEFIREVGIINDAIEQY